MNNLKISIITPSYNQGQFIEETIQSVLGQTYDNIEYIIIDAVSTDNTLGIIKKYDKDPRLKWISEKDTGQTNAMNKGFSMASGDILAWLNSDDIYDNEKVLESIANEFMNDQDLSLLYGKCYYINEMGIIVGEFESKEFNFERLLNYDCGIIPQPSCFFTKKAFNQVLKLDESLYYAMDYDLWIKLGRIGFAKYTPFPVSRFRRHKQSKTVSSVYRSRFEAWYVSRKNGGRYFSPLFFRLLYTSIKQFFKIID